MLILGIACALIGLFLIIIPGQNFLLRQGLALIFILMAIYLFFDFAIDGIDRGETQDEFRENTRKRFTRARRRRK